MHHNWVDNPFPLSVAMIDPKHVDTVDEIIEYYDNMDVKIVPRNRYRDLLYTLRNHVLSPVSDEDKEDAYRYLNTLEKRRNISFSDVFPHFSELVKTDK